MRTGFANFIRGDDLWQGDAGWAGYGKISNYGTTHVVNTVGSDLTVDNMGVLYIKPAVFLDISADDQIAGRDVSVSSSGLIYHGNNATLQAEGWIDINGGHYILDDLDATNEFTINGWMNVGMAGNLNMWNNTDHAGTLNILKLVIDGGAFPAAAEWIGYERRCCGFFDFRLEWESGGEPALVVTGPEGAKGMLTGW